MSLDATAAADGGDVALPAATWNGVAWILACVAGVLWIPAAYGLYLGIGWTWGTAIPPGVVTACALVMTFPVIGGLLGGLTTERMRRGLTTWAYGLAGLAAASVGPIVVFTAWDYPDESPHQFIVLGVMAVVSSVVAAVLVSYFAPATPARNRAGVAIVGCAVASVLLAPGMIERDIDTLLPMGATITRNFGQRDPHLRVVAKPISGEQAARYASRLGMSPDPEGSRCADDTVATPSGTLWRRDERVAAQEVTGETAHLSGCVLSASLCGDLLRVARECHLIWYW